MEMNKRYIYLYIYIYMYFIIYLLYKILHPYYIKKHLSFFHYLIVSTFAFPYFIINLKYNYNTNAIQNTTILQYKIQIQY